MSRVGRVWRRLAVGLAIAAVASSAAAGTALAGGDDSEPRVRDIEPRVRDVEPRVRDLTFRTNSVDNSERVVQAPEETSITLAADVLFDFDQASLTADALARLDTVADQLKDLGSRKITIGGHTDSVGDDAYNQDLSTRRAEAVRDALAERLSSDFSFDVTGYGETEPVAANENEDGSDNPDGRALNRRVEITFPT